MRQKPLLRVGAVVMLGVKKGTKASGPAATPRFVHVDTPGKGSSEGRVII